MKLTARMETIIALFSPVETAADIGCDHGIMAAELAERGIAGKVIAADISAPSLDKARILAKERGLGKRLECRLGNGLAVLQGGEAQGILIAGMGAPLIMQILQGGIEKALAAEFLVLSPNSYPERLRAFLQMRGFMITAEEMVADGKYYPVMRVCRGSESAYNREELLVGRHTRPNAAFRAYLDYKLMQTERIIEEMRAGGYVGSELTMLKEVYQGCLERAFGKGK